MDVLLGHIFGHSNESRAASTSKPSTHLQEMVFSATDELRGTMTDWDLTIEICDLAKAAPEASADALVGLKKRLAANQPPPTLLLSLGLLESLMKNCGAHTHQMVARKSFLGDALVKLLQVRDAPSAVHERLLGLIAEWAKQFAGAAGPTAAFPALHAALVAKGVYGGGNGNAPYPVGASTPGPESSMLPVYDEPLAYMNGSAAAASSSNPSASSRLYSRRGRAGADDDDEEEEAAAYARRAAEEEERLNEEQMQLAIHASLGGGGGGNGVRAGQQGEARRPSAAAAAGGEAAADSVGIETQMAALTNSVSLCRECLSAAGSAEAALRDEVLGDLINHLKDASPRVATAIGRAHHGDEELLRKMIALHEEMNGLLASYEQMVKRTETSEQQPPPFPVRVEAPMVVPVSVEPQAPAASRRAPRPAWPPANLLD